MEDKVQTKVLRILNTDSDAPSDIQDGNISEFTQVSPNDEFEEINECSTTAFK